MTSKKQSYTKPKLTIHGDVEVLTQASGSGKKLDADFKAGTLFGDLTFS